MKIEDKEYLRAARKIWCGDECTIQNVMWRCNQSIKDTDEETIIFTNQSTYKQVGSSGNDVIILIDGKGNRSGVHKCWFTSI